MNGKLLALALVAACCAGAHLAAADDAPPKASLDLASTFPGSTN